MHTRRGGHSTSSAWISVSVRILPCLLNLQCQLTSTDHLPFRSQIIGNRTSCSDNESMTLDDIGSCFIMVPKQKGPQWDLVVP